MPQFSDEAASGESRPGTFLRSLVPLRISASLVSPWTVVLSDSYFSCLPKIDFFWFIFYFWQPVQLCSCFILRVLFIVLRGGVSQVQCGHIGWVRALRESSGSFFSVSSLCSIPFLWLLCDL